MRALDRWLAAPLSIPGNRSRGLLMRSSHIDSETNTPLASTKVRRRTWPLVTCAATLGALAIVLRVKPAVQSAPSAATAVLAGIGITPVTPAKMLPVLGFTDAAQHALSLADFKGRPVLLNVWATWCAPCRQEMPSLDRLQVKLASSRFQVIAVSIDKRGLAVVQPFYRELELHSLAIYLDPSGKASTILGIEGVPATLLIDPEGREVGHKLGTLEWDSPNVIDALRKTFRLTDATPAMSTTSNERISP
jgi:thiol-disulfide isomerase/thioredoxin